MVKALDVDIDDADFVDIDSVEESEAEKELQNFLADLGTLNSVKITVYRVKEGKKLAWVTSIDPSDLDMEALFTSLRQEYGGGTFKVQVRDSGKIVKNRQVDIEPPPKVDDRFKQLEEKMERSMGGGSDTTRMIAEMQRMNMDMMRAMSESQAQIAQRQYESQQSIMQNIMAMMAAKDHGPTIDPMQMQATMLESVRALREMSEPAAKQDSTDLILKGIELATTLRESADAGNEANMYTVLSKAVGAFGGTMQQALASQTPDQMRQPASRPEAAPNKIPDKSHEATEAPALPDAHPLKPFESAVNLLVNRALKNSDPYIYAEFLIDEIGLEMAQQWIVTADGQTVIREHFPQTRHPEVVSWWGELAAVIDEIAQSAQDDGDADSTTQPDVSSPDHASIDGDRQRSSGDTPNVAAHGAVDAGSENPTASAGAGVSDSARNTGEGLPDGN